MRAALTWHYSQDKSVVALLGGNRAAMTADRFAVGHGVTASALWAVSLPSTSAYCESAVQRAAEADEWIGKPANCTRRR
jgi:hypothetical protein